VTRLVGWALVGIPVFLMGLHTLVRIFRSVSKFPSPALAVGLIDNPLRRWIQPPDETLARHGIRPGMRVLEVGLGNGTYTLATEQWPGAEAV
jgi:hypothetical protein